MSKKPILENIGNLLIPEAELSKTLGETIPKSIQEMWKEILHTTQILVGNTQNQVVNYLSAMEYYNEKTILSILQGVGTSIKPNNPIGFKNMEGQTQTDQKARGKYFKGRYTSKPIRIWLMDMVTYLVKSPSGKEHTVDEHIKYLQTIKKIMETQLEEGDGKPNRYKSIRVGILPTHIEMVEKVIEEYEKVKKDLGSP